ncbi:hypothetical protein HF086_002866 [Spodoptera exigua]|uniref:MADF domain-containing protein n=1 Tax=Spodoptera exigua TaxID=7107 RepID=A0A922MPH5_SPOEX|nr:hypothetical protein HF086_002866 [Spodoptera exigua]
MNWNDDDLIEQVKKYPVLYRDKRKNYKNIIKKGNCWIQIAAALNKTRETSSNNISADDSPSSPSNNIESFDIVVKEEYDAFAEVPPTESTFSYSAANSPDDSVPIITSVTPAPSRTPAARRAYKRKLDAIVDEMKKDREERNQIFKSLVDRNSGGQTSTHKFFSCMADIVSNFPLEKIAEIRMKIYSMVNDMELSIMKENSQ